VRCPTYSGRTDAPLPRSTQPTTLLLDGVVRPLHAGGKADGKPGTLCALEIASDGRVVVEMVLPAGRGRIVDTRRVLPSGTEMERTVELQLCASAETVVLHRLLRRVTSLAQGPCTKGWINGEASRAAGDAPPSEPALDHASYVPISSVVEAVYRGGEGAADELGADAHVPEEPPAVTAVRRQSEHIEYNEMWEPVRG
jgi:hypothetical protein